MADIFDLFKKIEKNTSSSAPITQIIAGLGNIGAEYDKTRHNAGFIAIDALAEKYGVELPITEAVYSVLVKGVTPREAMVTLMSRDMKSELE